MKRYGVWLLLIWLFLISQSLAQPLDQNTLPAPATLLPTKLHIATWNINKLSLADTQRIEAIAERLEASDLHLVAFQELTDQQTLNYLLQQFQPGQFRGFLANYIPYDLRVGFLYNPQLIDSISAHPLNSHERSSDWAQRTPILFNFRLKGVKSAIEFIAVNIHAKADIPDRFSSFQKRSRAAESLYKILTRDYASDRLIILGDFNDDIDQSIYKQRLSPYYLFREDHEKYRIATRLLTLNTQSTTLNHRQPIDHIIISDELFDLGSSNHVQLQSPLITNQQTGHSDTLSDHFLVRTSILTGKKQTHLSEPGKIKPQTGFIDLQNFPNPFGERTTFNFRLAVKQRVTITIHDLLGRLVKRMVHNQLYSAGDHEISWTPRAGISAGIYHYRLMTSTGSRSDGILTIMR